MIVLRRIALAVALIVAMSAWVPILYMDYHFRKMRDVAYGFKTDNFILFEFSVVDDHTNTKVRMDLYGYDCVKYSTPSVTKQDGVDKLLVTIPVCLQKKAFRVKFTSGKEHP